MIKETANNSLINWDELSFSLTPTRSMYKATCLRGEDWNEGDLVPFGNIELSPAAAVLNYGQGIFEGAKAYRTERNRIVVFRPAMNGERMQQSAKRLCIPPVSKEMFLNAIEKTVLDNIDFVPPINKGSLYIRPIIWGTGPVLGIQEAPSYTFLVYVSPVGPYFKGDISCLHIKVTKLFHRTATKGTGSIKAIGNYAASLYPLKNAKQEGFSELMYLNGQNEDLIDEMGSANVFALKGTKLITPKLSGSILPGVTRDSTIKIARDILGLEVIEKEVHLEDFLLADEVFCTGTAVVICPIGRITTDNDSVEISDKIGPITAQLRKTLLDIQLERTEDSFKWLYAINNC
ncbi:MAG: branched chain amino acid aminotransferase [Candidatus Marinimicrobia bacterium]|nr:branched chain amino acid aminotransferase [Candidatus Neomarinimicrobiota bacterium]|tara:strand:- start:14495 stop:15535 length:1041 start_codon:yes stop_codon:yes gene_type:complete